MMEKMREIGELAVRWGIEDALLSSVFHEETERRVYLISSKNGKYILKGDSRYESGECHCRKCGGARVSGQ